MEFFEKHVLQVRKLSKVTLKSHQERSSRGPGRAARGEQEPDDLKEPVRRIERADGGMGRGGVGQGFLWGACLCRGFWFVGEAGWFFHTKARRHEGKARRSEEGGSRGGAEAQRFSERVAAASSIRRLPGLDPGSRFFLI